MRFILLLLLFASTAVQAQFSGFMGKTQQFGITAEVMPMSNNIIDNIGTNLPDTTISKVYTSIGLTYERVISNHSTVEFVLRTGSFTGKFSNIESYGFQEPTLPDYYYVDSIRYTNYNLSDTGVIINLPYFEYDENYYYIARNVEFALNFKFFGDIIAPIGGYTLLGVYVNNTTFTPYDSVGYKYRIEDYNFTQYGGNAYYNKTLSTLNLGARLGIGMHSNIGNNLILDVAATSGVHLQALTTRTIKEVNGQEFATFGTYLSNDMYTATFRRSIFNFRVGLKYMF